MCIHEMRIGCVSNAHLKMRIFVELKRCAIWLLWISFLKFCSPSMCYGVNLKFISSIISYADFFQSCAETFRISQRIILVFDSTQEKVRLLMNLGLYIFLTYIKYHGAFVRQQLVTCVKENRPFLKEKRNFIFDNAVDVNECLIFELSVFVNTCESRSGL